MADPAAPHILLPAEEVQYFAGQHVLHQGVHREVPPPRGFLCPEEGIDKDRKVLVSAACGRLGAGHGDIQLIVPQTHDAEARAHGQPLAEAVQNAFQGLYWNTVHLDVNVLVLPAQEPVPHKAAHIIGAAALTRDCCGYPAGHFHIPVVHPSLTSGNVWGFRHTLPRASGIIKRRQTFRF